jgi:hypothetical protein
VRKLAGLAVLSAAVLALQVDLTRVLSIGQYYHFAFLVISLALLGFGASGTMLTMWPRLAERASWPWYGLGFALGALVGYLVVNHAAFDSYRIALEPAQAIVLVLDLLALALPFLFGGALVAAMLRAATERSGRTYGATLLGSAAGAILAPIAIETLGSPRTVLLCGAAGAVAALLLFDRARTRSRATAVAGLGVILGLLVVFPAVLDVVPSPYKRISQMALDPEARIVATRESASARLDVVESPTIHSAPGLSLTYHRPLPDETGLVVDGDTLLPVIDAARAPPELADALPVSVALAARPVGRVLFLGSGGGLDAWAALTRGVREVTVVEPNGLVVDALTGLLRDRAALAGDPRVRLVHDEIRTFAVDAPGPYDIVELTLADNYRPISAGAFTLSETYTLTVDGVRDYLRLAGPDGLLVITRWVQEPPSESARALAIVTEALGDRPAREHVIAFRSFQTVTILAKASAFSADEVDALLGAIDQRHYDLVAAPTIPPGSVNRYAVLPEVDDHELAVNLLDARDRAPLYAAWPLDIAPTTDDRPFFFQFFRWEQTPVLLEELGRRWQPFGGSGYLVVVGLLAFALVATALLVVAPIALRPSFRGALVAAGAGVALRTVGYATAIGLAFLFVEVSLVQRLILLIGAPTLAFAAVVGGLLFWSGLGSLASSRLPWRPAIVVLVVLLAVAPAVIGALTPTLLGLPLAARIAAVLVLLAPAGILMGVPFPRLVSALGPAPGLVPWAWAANGGASVVGAVTAPMIALSAGFGAVLGAGAALYLAAALAAGRGLSPPASAARTAPRAAAPSPPPLPGG